MPDAAPTRGPARHPTGVPSVVNYRQEGTIYDVPIEVLWEFMTWEGHGGAHEKTLRNFAVLEKTADGLLYRCETLRGGAWRKVRGRLLDFPPLGRIVQEIAGPYTGTQMVFLYTPAGRKTRLDIVARLVSDTFDAKTLERHMADSIDTAGVEDDPYLQRFAKSRTRG
jgi:hypothetical protein